MNKIDSNKLLSPSKNSAIQKKIDSSVLVPYKNIKISTKKINLGKKTGEEKGDDELIKTISSIKESLLQIESLLKNNSNILARKLKRDKKDKENERRKEKETNLETKKSDKDKFPNLKKPNLPRTGIFDYIKNFLTWVIIGRAFVLFSKYLPKLLEFVKYLTPLYDFVKTITGALFNGLVTFVEWTDKAQKKLREVVGSLGGEPFQKAFDDFGGALTTFMNLALIAGMATMGGSDLGVGDALDDIDPDGKKPKGSRRRPGVTTSGGRRAGRPGLRNPLRQRPKITGTPGLRNPLRQRPKVTGTPGLNNPLKQRPKITGATNAPANVPKLPPSAGSAGKLGAKALLKTVRPILRGMIIGGLIDFGLSVALGEDPGRAAFGAIGATLLGTIGGILGGPAAPLTALAGGALGDWAGRKLYDAFFSGQKTTPQSKPQIAGGGMGGRRGGRGMQGGGSVQPKTGTPLKQKSNKNSTEKIKPPNILPAKKVKPGKDVGGEQKIKKLFPNTDPDAVSVEDWINAVDANGDRYTGTYSDFVESRRRLYKGKPNPFKALTRTSDILKRIPVVGTLMGAGVDAALGQAFDTKGVIEQFTSSMGYVVDSISKQQISNLENSIKTFSEGGSISSAENISENYNQISSARLLEKLLGPSIEKRVNRAVSGIKNDIEKAKTPEEIKREEERRREEGGGADGDTPGAKLRDGTNAKIEADLLEYYTALYGKNAAIGIVANLRRESGYRTKTPDNNLYEGMAQWSRDDRWPRLVKWAESKGLDPYSRNAQAQYLAIELKQLGTDKRLKDAKTPEQAASIFYNEFERGYYSKAVKGNSYDPDNPHENKNKGFIQDITKSNPDIGKRGDDVLEKPTFDAKVSPGTFKQVTGTSGSSSLNPNVPLSVPYSPFTSDLGKPEITSAKGKRYHPVTGQLKDHNGLDIAADAGTPIYSYLPGTVVFSGSSGGYGFRVEIKDSKGNIHSFSHLQSDPGLRVGQKIEQGQLVGRVGSTGLSSGPHLHWEIQNSSGAYLDPVNWTKQNPLPKPKSKLQLAQDKISSMKLGDAPYEVPGFGKVIIKKNEFGTVVKEYYDTNGNIVDSGKFFDALKNNKPTGSPAKPGQQPAPKAQSFSASQIAYSNLNDRVSQLKVGEKIVFDKVGSIQAGTGWLGGRQIKYYNTAGSSISKEDFDNLLKNSEVFKKMRSNNRKLQNLQGGGNINMNYKNIQRPTGLNTYEDEENTVVYIQPVYFIPDQNQTYIKSPSPMMVSSGNFVRSSSYIP
jgi:murein DD-endopeptidase MepM/ murein hydrolase activator NlpD